MLRYACSVQANKVEFFFCFFKNVVVVVVVIVVLVVIVVVVVVVIVVVYGKWVATSVPCCMLQCCNFRTRAREFQHPAHPDHPGKLYHPASAPEKGLTNLFVWPT